MCTQNNEQLKKYNITVKYEMSNEKIEVAVWLDKYVHTYVDGRMNKATVYFRQIT